MLEGLAGKTALVTGGGRGIGRATAVQLARQGVDVIVNYLRDEAAAQETVAQVRACGRRACAIAADVGNLAAAEELLGRALLLTGRLDIVVCNAGLWAGGAVEAMDEETWQSVLDANLKGTWTVCKAAVPQLKRQGGGHIVIVSSTAGQRGEAFYSNYAAAKGGQIAFTKSLAAELAGWGISVNAVAPGWVVTEMTREALGGEAERAEITKGIPVGRIATPEEIAAPIAFLCSPWASHINGEILNINGGSVLCG